MVSTQLPPVTPFCRKLDTSLAKQPITVLQVNLGRRCNQACNHCHVEAGPHRTEEMSASVCEQVVQLIQQFPALQTVDLTGGAPEMNSGFRPIVEAARAADKQVMVRTNLTIYFVEGYADLPDYCARHRLHLIASLPCYLAENVDRMRGTGVFDESVRAIQLLNRLGYGRDPHLLLDLVYNPQVPASAERFSLPPNQQLLERDYKTYLREHFGIEFNQLFAIANLPIGRTKFHLQHRQLYEGYLHFLEENYNPATVEHLMCRNELSIDYLGNVYDCDFNQMEGVPARTPAGKPVMVADLLEARSLDVISEVQTRPYCYGCTAGSGSSCGGALI